MTPDEQIEDSDTIREYEEQQDYWSLLDDGRNDDGTGESYGERNA